MHDLQTLLEVGQNGGKTEMKTRYSFTRGIRKRSSGLLLLSILLLGLAGLALSACSGATAPAPEPEPASLAGYVILEEDKLYVDEVEVITTENPDKMAELGWNGAKGVL